MSIIRIVEGSDCLSDCLTYAVVSVEDGKRILGALQWKLHVDGSCWVVKIWSGPLSLL
jgi:hypothetical protein